MRSSVSLCLLPLPLREGIEGRGRFSARAIPNSVRPECPRSGCIEGPWRSSETTSSHALARGLYPPYDVPMYFACGDLLFVSSETSKASIVRNDSGRTRTILDVCNRHRPWRTSPSLQFLMCAHACHHGNVAHMARMVETGPVGPDRAMLNSGVAAGVCAVKNVYRGPACVCEARSKT
jgi:hypothetical protein